MTVDVARGLAVAMTREELGRASDGWRAFSRTLRMISVKPTNNGLRRMVRCMSFSFGLIDGLRDKQKTTQSRPVGSVTSLNSISRMEASYRVFSWRPNDLNGGRAS